MMKDRARRLILLAALAVPLMTLWPATKANADAQRTVVVFLPGLGDGAASFRGISRRLGGQIDAVLDERPADTRSLSDGFLTPVEAAEDLHNRLRAADKLPPYTLVAHSLAGLYALEFARLYPTEVSGILLADARLPGFDARCHDAGLAGCTVPKALFALMPHASKAELRGAEALLGAQIGPDDWTDVRLTLIVATRAPTGLSRGFQDLWIAHAQAFAKARPFARLVLAKGSGHYVQRQAAQLVAQELADLIADGT